LGTAHCAHSARGALPVHTAAAAVQGVLGVGDRPSMAHVTFAIARAHMYMPT